jgi:hypothetical protein
MNCNHGLFQQLGIARRKAEVQIRHFGALTGIRRCVSSAVMICGLLAISGPALAGPIVLPNAQSYEYFGLNYAINEQTSNTVGTLNYTGSPGCGGICTATTALGSDPQISLAVNEIAYEGAGGGGAEAELLYYVEYVNTPGTYNVTLNATDSFSIPAGIQYGQGQSYIAIGPSGCDPNSFYDFCSYTYRDTDCVNGCSAGVIPDQVASPIPASVPLEMVANEPYAVDIWVTINPATSGLSLTASLDPTFSTSAPGGTFYYSAGITNPESNSPVPEPATWTMMLMAMAGLGGMMRLRKSTEQV